MHINCFKCFIEQANKLFKKYGVEEEKARDIIVRLRLFIEDHEADISAPEISCLMHRMIGKITQTEDLYRKEKNEFNTLLLSLEEEIRDVIAKSKDPFQTALRYALAGNIIDFGPPQLFDIFKAISAATTKVPAIDHSGELRESLSKASTILYLGDNAGEIVFDKLFIETINHPKIYFAVRGYNIINDVTTEDAKNVGIGKFAKIISNGYDAPSTILYRCSKEFRRIFDKADVIISKGQGNLEGLIDNKEKHIFFLLMVKCGVISELIGVHQKNSVVLDNRMLPVKGYSHQNSGKSHAFNTYK